MISTEMEVALRLANTVLDKPYIDPDGDICMLARQLIRSRERETGALNRLANWMIAQGYVTGHGDSADQLLGELEVQSTPSRDMVAALRALSSAFDHMLFNVPGERQYDAQREAERLLRWVDSNGKV